MTFSSTVNVPAEALRILRLLTSSADKWTLSFYHDAAQSDRAVYCLDRDLGVANLHCSGNVIQRVVVPTPVITWLRDRLMLDLVSLLDSHAHRVEGWHGLVVTELGRAALAA